MTDVQFKVADLFCAFTQHKNFLRDLTIFDVDQIDEQLTLADERLSESEFEDTALAKEILGDSASKAKGGEELHDMFIRFRRCVWEMAYSASCGRLEELAAKANIWQRTASQTMSKCPDGLPDEFLMWSLFKDLQAASNEKEMNLKNRPSIAALQDR